MVGRGRFGQTGPMNDTRTPETLPLRHAMDALGFRPAMLDCATMTIYQSFDGLPASPHGTLLAGFERRGFFYTRASAERAAREWM
jgi:hypothetical protein